MKNKGTNAEEPMAMTYGMSDYLMDKDLPPYTLDELHARIEESHASYLRGDYVTAEESNTLLKEKYLWLQ